MPTNIACLMQIEKKQMTVSNQDLAWGFHLNESIYSLLCPPCPKWAKSWEQEKWHTLGVVVWDARINRVTHLHGSQALHILEQSRQSRSWKKEGLLVGEVAYCFTIPSNKKSKSKIAEQPESKTPQEDGWRLTNTIQLAADQTQQFVSFLEQHEANLKKVVEEETAERGRILAQVYSLILSWGNELHIPVMSHSESGPCRTVRGGKSAVVGIVP